MIRTAVAAVALIGGIYLAAHNADMAWAALVGGVIAYVVAPHGKSKTSKR